MEPSECNERQPLPCLLLPHRRLNLGQAGGRHPVPATVEQVVLSECLVHERHSGCNEEAELCAGRLVALWHDMEMSPWWGNRLETRW